MILDSLQLSRFQLCRRRWLIERQWKYLRWHPTSLFSSCLREAVFSLSNGQPAEEVIASAHARYMTIAAQPGLDIMVGDPYQIASDFTAMLATVLTAMSRLTLLTLRRLPPVELSPALSWQPLAFADDSGTLHRILTCDAWDMDAQARAIHSWHTVGELAACDAPMTLHVIEIGQLRNGRRASPWCRAYRNPAYIPSGPSGQIRFQRPDGKGGWASLRGDSWQPAWLADMPRYDPAAWVDRMEADGVTPRLLQHSSISPLSEESRARILSEIAAEAREMERLQSANRWDQVPMARGSCDRWRPCEYQGLCYSPDPVASLESSSLYQIRPATTDASARSGLLPLASPVGV